MPRRIQATYTNANRATVAALGDSLTGNSTTQQAPAQFWPERLAVGLRALGAHAKARAFGHSGNTTTTLVSRAAILTQYDVPALAVLWGGVNDPGAGIAGATTQANLQSLITTLLGAGCGQIIVLTTQFLNFSGAYTAGTQRDTLATPYATYATLRLYQAAAVAAFAGPNPGQVVLCDLYTYLRNLIVAGTESAGSFSWHVADGNIHLNALGNAYVAAALLATIQAQPGWLAALSVP